MLKLTYTEMGLHLERVVASMETLIAQRVLLALRSGQRLHVEPGKASFLLPADTRGLAQLETAIRWERNAVISVVAVDDDFVEVCLAGSWVAESAAAHEGMFIAAFSERAEFLIYKLWQATQAEVSSLA